MMRFARLYPRKFSKRRLVIWGGSLFVVLIVACYLLWSHQAWSQYKPAYTQWHQQIKTDIDKVVVLPTNTPKERAHALTAFLTVTQQIKATQHTICTLHPLLQWQVAIDSLKKERITCQDQAKQAIAFNEQLQKVAIHLQDDQALATIITTIPQSDQLDDTAWAAQVAAWTTGVNLVKTMNVGESFKPVQAQAVKRMTMVVTAWQEVIAASQAKDKKRYLTSQDSLASAYDSLNEVTVTNDKILLELTQLLQEEYAKAFTHKI